MGPPALVRFWDDLGLLGEREAEVVRRHGDTLLAFEQEAVTKSYKLVTIKAMLHDGTLRTGQTIGEVSGSSQNLISADPRLILDATGAEMTDPAGASDEQWQRFWMKWPLTHLTKNDGLFELENDRILPRFVIDEDLGDAFDAMVAEITEWRLAEYLLRDKSQGNAVIRCRVSHSDGRPIVFLDRGEHPNLPEGWTELQAGGEILRGNFVKVASNVAEREGEKGNALHDLLRGWFGPAAGHPGTNHAVVLRATSHGWERHQKQRQPAATQRSSPSSRATRRPADRSRRRQPKATLSKRHCSPPPQSHH